MSRRMSLADPNTSALTATDRVVGVAVLSAAFVMLRFRSLSQVGALIRFLRRHSRRGPRRDPLRSWQAVHWPSPLFVGRAGCFELALAVTLLCVLRGHRNAELAIGCRMDPFESHSWVEVDGRPLNEPEGFVEGFRKVVVL